MKNAFIIATRYINIHCSQLYSSFKQNMFIMKCALLNSDYEVLWGKHWEKTVLTIFIFFLQIKSLQKAHDTGSDTSAETIGSDSGRGGSESELPNSANNPGNKTS